VRGSVACQGICIAVLGVSEEGSEASGLEAYRRTRDWRLAQGSGVLLDSNMPLQIR
jgi:riboflavin synthase alpha subunit